MLIGKKVALRPLKIEDLKKTILWHNDLEIKELAMCHPFPVTEELEKEWLENILTSKDNRNIYFAIEELKNKNCIGITHLKNINWIHRYCYFGIIVGEKSEQGKGYGRETLSLIIEYAFHSLNLQKILLEVITKNKKAIKLYEDFGFKVEGQLKNQFFIKGQYHDTFIMSLLKNKVK